MSFNHSIASNSDALLQSPKIAAGVSGGAFAVGSATWLEWLPQYIGICASSVAILVSLAILYNAIVGGALKRKLDKKELQVASLQEEQLIREKNEMRNKNEPRK